MSQTSPQVCPTCRTPAPVGQQFCANCGSVLPAQGSAVGPTASASSPYNSGAQPPSQGQYTMPSSSNYNPTVQSSDPYNPSSNPNYQSTERADAYGSPSGSNYQSAPAPYNSVPTPQVHTQYDAPPPPPTSSDPYANVSAPVPGTYPNYTPPTGPNKKRSPLLYIIIGIIVVLLLACGGGAYAIYRGVSNVSNQITASEATSTVLSGGSVNSNNIAGHTPSTTYPATQSINLTVTYASDQLTFNSIQQQNKFSDDDLSQFSDNSNPNFVRVSFKEQQTAKSSSYFDYTSSFSLTLADGTVVKAQKAAQYTGPDQSVTRNNWVDFSTNGEVDLSKLKMTLGSSDEAQMTFPLQTGANVSQFNPKNVALNKQTNYAGVDWTLKDATQSLYFNGTQAKTNEVYITIDLVANNNSGNDVDLFDFARLKAGDSTVSPDDNSDTNNFDVINAGTTNVTGSLTFLIQPTSSGAYTLNFLAGDNISAQSVDFQIS